ncbi:MAG: c-type cytochrome [Campylobacterales bacterium]|nr:c-type cytochrome [Campylobacterales bacterium]
MLKIAILISLPISYLSSNLIGEINSSFITQKEYGKMLYENPRGIGCNKCHGDNAKGSFIASYKHKSKNEITKKSYTITAPDIRNIEFGIFKKVVNRQKNNISIMPTYFLTDDELKSIHFYLKSFK